MKPRSSGMFITVAPWTGVITTSKTSFPQFVIITDCDLITIKPRCNLYFLQIAALLQLLGDTGYLRAIVFQILVCAQIKEDAGLQLGLDGRHS